MGNGLYLGGVIDPKSGDRGTDVDDYDPADLTTHGIIVGMTGSGKTGLGIIFLEEALRRGIPALILDPKGDMTNLLLNFPDLAPGDFQPWIDPTEARAAGKSVTEVATAAAETWKNGLADWDLGPEQMRALKTGTDFTIYTPGSQAGVPLNILGSLAAPKVDFETEKEALRDEIEGFVSGILGLIDISADPLSSREHILLSNLIENAWSKGKDLDLETLLGQVQQPPIRKLGVFEIDTFFPEKDRTALAMKLNALIASPSFSSWLAGPPLDIGTMLWNEDRKPGAAIIYLAHLSDDERQFIVTLILSKMVTWMRAQSGSTGLRALVYMDEVFGFAPPTAEPPAKKPILTLLKQARAFGVGLLLSTQNPVDLDYKAMSNAGTWCVGRLQTERDKARILEGLQSAGGGTDIPALDKTITGLDKRQFLLHNTRAKAPTLFTTRWAMSYLRGPLTKDEVAKLVAGSSAKAKAESIAPPSADAPPTASIGDDETTVAPDVAEGITTRWLDPAAPWAAEVGAEPGGTTFVAGFAAKVHLVFDDTTAGLSHREEWEAVTVPLTEPFDPAELASVDYDDRDFRTAAPKGALYRLPAAPIDQAAFFKAASASIKEHLYRERTVQVFRNPSLKLYSRVGESEEDFTTRCDEAAQAAADKEVAKLRKKLETKMARLQEQIRAAQARVQELTVDVNTRKQTELLSGAGQLLGSLLGGRSSTRAISTMATRRGQVRRTEKRKGSAEDKVAALEDRLNDLEQESVAEVALINEEWASKGDQVEKMEVGLEKTDIEVADVMLVWVPVA